MGTAITYQANERRVPVLLPPRVATAVSGAFPNAGTAADGGVGDNVEGRVTRVTARKDSSNAKGAISRRVVGRLVAGSIGGCEWELAWGIGVVRLGTGRRGAADPDVLLDIGCSARARRVCHRQTLGSRIDRDTNVSECRAARRAGVLPNEKWDTGWVDRGREAGVTLEQSIIVHPAKLRRRGLD